MKTVQAWEAVQTMFVATLALYAHALATQFRPAWLFTRWSNEKASKAPFKF